MLFYNKTFTESAAVTFEILAGDGKGVGSGGAVWGWCLMLDKLIVVPA